MACRCRGVACAVECVCSITCSASAGSGRGGSASSPERLEAGELGAVPVEPERRLGQGSEQCVDEECW